MRVSFIILFAALSLAKQPRKCSPVNQVLNNTANLTFIEPELCPSAPPETSFQFWSKPILGFMNKWLGRHGLTAKEADTLKNRHWSILNVPAYANYTPPHAKSAQPEGWNVRVHGNLYKRRHMTRQAVNDLINRVLIRASVKREHFLYKIWFQMLKPDEAHQARRQVRELATAGIEGGVIGMNLCQDDQHETLLPHLTNSEGAFEDTVSLNNTCSTSPEEPYSFGPDHDIASQVRSKTMKLAPLNVRGDRQSASEDTQETFFVPPRGLTIVSDIDDVLRVGETWNWKQAILDLFARPYQPWLGMTDVFGNWSTQIPQGGGGRTKDGKWQDRDQDVKDSEVGSNITTNVHFHYATDTPEVNAAFYMDGTKK